MDDVISEVKSLVSGFYFRHDSIHVMKLGGQHGFSFDIPGEPLNAHMFR